MKRQKERKKGKIRELKGVIRRDRPVFAVYVVLRLAVLTALMMSFLRGEYEHGRWNGVSVEDIRYSKMLQDGKLPDGAELPHNSIYYDKRKAAK